TSDSQPPQWQNWSDPTLVRDDENFDVELSTQAKDINGGPVAPVKYNEATSDPYLPCNSHRPLSGEEGYDASIPVVDQIWFDPELDSGYISEHSNLFNWMATRSRYVTVQGQPAWRPWTIILVKGEDGGTGASGIGFQHAYIAVPKNGTPNIQEDSNHPGTYISTNSGATGTWTIGTNGVTVQAGQALWMSERTVHDGIYGSWGTPVRLSGPDGSPGEDAENIEFIYKRSNRLPNNSSGNSDKPTLNDYTVDEYIPNYSLHSNDDGVSPSDNIPQNQDWTDSPSGVDPDHKYEWMCQRIKPRTTDPNEPWDDWSDVFVWSAYGDTGMDGDGVEYIFYRRNTKPYTPVGPHYRAVEGGSITEWKGGVVNVAEEGETPEWEPKDLSGSFHEWVYGSYNPQGEWIPTHWYTSSSTIGAVGNSIKWTDEPTGVGEETNPDWDSEDPESSPTITYLYEWVSVRKRVGGEWGKFSEPTQWSNYAVTPIITIENGVWVINGEPTEH
ncbi:MAG: hypothetical protein VZR31_08890, partial [Lachnospiraceae bacterium]|nr:hypothetical protein [Lachnospiraceae bacterium]